MELKDHDYYTLNIFKEGDNENNNKFYNKLKEFVWAIEKGVGKACTVFKKVVEKLIHAVLEKK